MASVTEVLEWHRRDLQWHIYVRALKKAMKKTCHDI
jgi:hypothetical protein